MEPDFYNDGLRFECVRCSNCCRHEPGYVFLSENDLSRLASGVNTKREEFVSRYCRDVAIGGFKQISLTEKANYDCIFWEEGGCVVYEHRPLQCRTYPFWAQNLLDEETWIGEKKHCPGIGAGKNHTKEAIEEMLNARLRETPL